MNIPLPLKISEPTQSWSEFGFATIQPAGVVSEGREPLRLVVPAGVPIELWDSGLATCKKGGAVISSHTDIPGAGPTVPEP